MTERTVENEARRGGCVGAAGVRVSLDPEVVVTMASDGHHDFWVNVEGRCSALVLGGDALGELAHGGDLAVHPAVQFLVAQRL